MKRFFPRQKREPEAGQPETDYLARRIALAVLRRQSQIAAALNRRTAHYSRRGKIMLLILICLLLGGLNLYVLFSGLFRPG